MPNQIATNPSAPLDVDDICNRFALSRSTACNIVQSYLGDPQKALKEAERLAKYEALH
jgi:hypothetical protein